MSLWVSPTTSVASKTLIGKAEEFRVFTNASGQVGCQTKTTTWQTAAQASTNALAVGTWSHVICTYDLVNLKVYVNGTQVASQALTSLPDDTANLLKIGQDDSASTPYSNLSGTIDEFKFYNYALTGDEIKTDYNRGSSLILGALGSNSSYQPNAANQEYCVPGDSGTCSAPVAAWSFEEGKDNTCSGGTNDVCDTSGSGNDGAWNGTGSHWITGKVGKGGNFNGSDDYVTTASTPTTGNGSFSIFGWIKTSATGSRREIIDWGTSVTNQALYLFINSSNQLELDLENVLGPNSSSTITDGNWHYVGVINNSGTIQLYVDGKAVGSSQSMSPNIGTGVAYIGRHRGNSINYFSGLIDQIRIFNYARTPAQIAWDYNKGAPVGHWKFDECQGSVAHDSAIPPSGGTRNDGTITVGSLGSQASLGTCAANAATAWYNGVSGKRNYSLKLDGNDDYVSVSDTANLRFNNSTDDFSLFAWVKRTTTGTEYILSKEDADNDGYRLLFTSSNTVQCSEDATDVTSTSTITDTNWHLIGCTIDRDGNGQVYIDGKADGTAAAMGTDAMATTSSLILGTRSYTSTSYLNGQIDDVRIYNYALTATQVKNVYNNGAIFFGPSTGSP